MIKKSERYAMLQLPKEIHIALKDYCDESCVQTSDKQRIPKGVYSMMYYRNYIDKKIMTF